MSCPRTQYNGPGQGSNPDLSTDSESSALAIGPLHVIASLTASLTCQNGKESHYEELQALLAELKYGKMIYNLGQNKWNMWTNPSPHFKDAKMSRFALYAPSSLLLGGKIIVPICCVQDYNLGQNKWNIWSPLLPISNIPKWRVLLFMPLHHCLGGGRLNDSFSFYPRL